MKRKEVFPAEKPTKKKNIKLFEEYGLIVIILFFVTSSLIQGSRVPTGSMETTIMTGDWIINNKLAFDLTTPRNIPFTDIELPHLQLLKWGDPQRNDIVVFEFPGNRDEIKNSKIETYVKRCVAVPGDVVQIVDRILYINTKEFPIPPNIQYLRGFS